MNKISRFIKKVSLVVIGFSVMCIIFLVILQVFGRFLGFTIVFGYELARFFFVWMIFIGASLGVADREHFVFEFILNKVPAKVATVLKYFVCIIILLVSIILLYYGIKYSIIGWGRYTAALEWRLTWAILSIPVGSFFMVIHSIINIIKLKNEEFNLQKQRLI